MGKEYPGSQSAMTLKLNLLARRRLSSDGWNDQDALTNVRHALGVATGNGDLYSVVSGGIDQVSVASRESEIDHLKSWPEFYGEIQRRFIALVILESIEQRRPIVYDWTVDLDDHFVYRDMGDLLSLTFYNPPNQRDPHVLTRSRR